MNPRRRLAAVLAAAVGIGALAGCGSSGTSGSSGSGPVVSVATSPAASGIRGATLPDPVQLSVAARSASFRSSRGGTTTLEQLQRGRLMLVFFGYTHCPDECPTTMADLAQALRSLPSLPQSHTQVVFVTSDPSRDRPAVLAAWLANFDRGLLLPFVGLTASVGQIDTIAASVGVPLSPPVRNADGSISVQHGTQTLAFVGGKAAVAWSGGTTVEDFAHDIELLVSRVKDAP